MVISTDNRRVVDISTIEGKYPPLGYFEGTIVNASRDIGKNGSVSITLNLKSKNDDEWPITVYNAIRITNNDGSDNYQISTLLVPLLLTTGLKEIDPDITQPTKIKVGKAQIEKMIDIYPVLSDRPIACWLKKEYKLWEGKLRETYFITDFFRIRDKASGKEIQDNLPVGKRYNELIMEDNTEVYLDGLTPDLVQKMKSASKAAPVAAGWLDTSNTSSTGLTQDEEDDLANLWDDDKVEN